MIYSINFCRFAQWYGFASQMKREVGEKPTLYPQL